MGYHFWEYLIQCFFILLLGPLASGHRNHMVAPPIIRRVHQHLPATNQRQVDLARFRQVRVSRDLGPRT